MPISSSRLSEMARGRKRCGFFTSPPTKVMLIQPS